MDLFLKILGYNLPNITQTYTFVFLLNFFCNKEFFQLTGKTILLKNH